MLKLAAIAIAVFLVLIIRRRQRNIRKKNEERRMKAHIEHYVEHQYPATLTKEQIKEMNTERWS